MTTTTLPPPATDVHVVLKEMRRTRRTRRVKGLEWFVPYHDGAVAYFKELGVWSDHAQAHNDRLIARQEALAVAWKALAAENPADWDNAWAERRRQALKDGGFQVIF